MFLMNTTTKALCRAADEHNDALYKSSIIIIIIII